MTHEPPRPQESSETHVLELLKKIQQQLTFLERKIDALGSGGVPAPFRKEGFFPRKPRPFAHPHQSGGGHGAGPGHFPKPPYHDRSSRGERRGFAHPKKSFFHHRRGNA